MLRHHTKDVRPESEVRIAGEGLGDIRVGAVGMAVFLFKSDTASLPPSKEILQFSGYRGARSRLPEERQPSSDQGLERLQALEHRWRVPKVFG